jgi:small conductance mechanosensitive channel
MDSLQVYTHQAISLLMAYLPRLVLAIVVLLVGLWIIRVTVRVLQRGMAAKEMDATLQRFLGSLVGISLKVMLLISIASMVGIATTSFIAVLGAAGLAVGLALQGSLANFAGGVLIMIFRPYKVGDFIDAQGHAGTVREIQIFNTILKTPDNKTIIIPNGAISNGSVVNISTEPTRRVDMVFGISYDDDIKKVKNILQKIIDRDSRILKEPAPAILVSELADSSVNFTLRVWCNAGDYWGIYFDMHEIVKLEFDKEGVSIPYPQQDIHLHKAETA